jgi:hypothetical protein
MGVRGPDVSAAFIINKINNLKFFMSYLQAILISIVAKSEIQLLYRNWNYNYASAVTYKFSYCPIIFAFPQ